MSWIEKFRSSEVDWVGEGGVDILDVKFGRTAAKCIKLTP